jgi:hypothetical protein
VLLIKQSFFSNELQLYAVAVETHSNMINKLQHLAPLLVFSFVKLIYVLLLSKMNPLY